MDDYEKVVKELNDFLDAISEQMDKYDTILTDVIDKVDKYDPEVNFTYIGETGLSVGHHGIITLAYMIDHDVLHYGVSFCSPKDRYNKATGKKQAYTRLMDHGIVCGIVDKRTHHHLRAKILCDMYVNGNYPEWAEKIIGDEIKRCL